MEAFSYIRRISAHFILLYIENNNILNVIRRITNFISELIEQFSLQIVIQWIPSHCNLPGNEVADLLAKIGASQDQPDIPVNQKTCKQIIKEKSKKTMA